MGKGREAWVKEERGYYNMGREGGESLIGL